VISALNQFSFLCLHLFQEHTGIATILSSGSVLAVAVVIKCVAVTVEKRRLHEDKLHVAGKIKQQSTGFFAARDDVLPLDTNSSVKYILLHTILTQFGE
jgi:hypothetical protein